MRALLRSEFAALLARAGTSQAAFARPPRPDAASGQQLVPRASRGPPWAAALAAVQDQHSPDAIAIMVDEALFTWHETLGVPPAADAAAVRRAMTRLALAYHPDKGGTQQQMARINAAYEQARTYQENRSPAKPPPGPGRRAPHQSAEG